MYDVAKLQHQTLVAVHRVERSADLPITEHCKK